MIKLAEFLIMIALIIAKYPQCTERFDGCKRIADNYNSTKRTNFILNIYKPIKPVSKNYDDFVLLFNTEILNLQIDLKNCGGFVPLSPLFVKHETCCAYCGSTESIECDGSIQCGSCGAICRNQSASAWSDIARVHTTPVYCYDRKNQFKECLLQYQGKCDNFVDINVPKPQKHLTKMEFYQMLKADYKHQFHQEHFHCLYYKTMKIAAPDLTEIENAILNDFDTFTKSFTKYNKQCSGVSNNFVLYQLLNRHGHLVIRGDVLLANSIDSASDRACRSSFKTLGWKLYR